MASACWFLLLVTVATCASGGYALPRDCYDIERLGQRSSELHRVFPTGRMGLSKRVWCDMDTVNGRQPVIGGWTVIQRRTNGRVNFNRNWDEYKRGFGSPKGEFWLGNKWITLLTGHRRHTLRVDVTSFTGRKYYAEYSNFRIANETENFKLLSLGKVTGSYGGEGSSLRNGLDFAFSTYDKDTYISPSFSCAKKYKAGWWFNDHDCSDFNLNAKYKRRPHKKSDVLGVQWWKLGVKGRKVQHIPAKTVEMKIRPTVKVITVD